PELELGFPWFFYYQHLPHLTVVGLHRLFFQRQDLLTIFNALRYALLVTFPIVVCWSMRTMQFSRVAAAAGATAASLFSTNGPYGFDYGSYVWRGFGMYTQLWAMPLSMIALACMDRLIDRGKGHITAVAAFTVLALSHLIYAYMMAITGIVLLLVGVRP